MNSDALFAAPHGATDDFDVFGCALDGIQLIEASAGTGKTWNICGLYLRLLLERGLTVQQVLVVTFTRAATAELKRRIRTRIVEMLACLDGEAAALPAADPFAVSLLAALKLRGVNDETTRQRLDAALQTFDEAAIFTIHGYCQRALADTPFAAGLPFALELGENDSALCLEVTQDFWRKHIAGGDNPAALGTLLAARNDSPERWARLLAQVMAHPTALQRWPGTTVDITLEDAADALQHAFDAARHDWDEAENGAGGNDAVATLLENMGGNLKGNIYKTAAVLDSAQYWRQWFASGDALFRDDFDKNKLALLCADRMDACLNKNGIAPRHPFFDAASGLLQLREQLDERLEALRTALLRRFVDETPQRLRAIKRERRRISFDDILFNVYRALDHGGEAWLADELQRRYPAALIDEFQDTDPLQFGIFRRIYSEGPRHGTLFLVGDPKQAIYRFRNADLHTYLYARRLADRHHTLRFNQRSDAALIEACNCLFSANRHAFILDELAYEPVREGQKPRERLADLTVSGNDAALRIWWAPDDATADGGGLLSRAELMTRATHATAAEAARLIGAGQTGAMLIGDRPLQPGDIAILVKTHRQGAQMRDALAELGVGSVELSQQSVFFSSDAEALLAVLRAIGEPTQQPLLMAALASPLYGRDAVFLQELANDENALVRTLSRFSAWHDIWLTRGVAVMLRQWMSDEGIAARLLTRDDGERRLTNLLHLFECLHEAAAQHQSPDALLRWLSGRMRPDNVDAMAEAAQLRLESDRNLVQIVTIHRAKGLEYPVVFCPFLWDGLPPRGNDADAGLLYHETGDTAQAPQLIIDFRAGARDDENIAFTIRRENDAELLRLYYVALTRAVHRFYLIAGCYVKPAGKSVSSREGARSLLNWLVAGGDMDYRQWLHHRLETEEIRLAWQRLPPRASSPISITALPDGHGERLAMRETVAGALHAQTPPARLPETWHIGSFSALKRGMDHEAGGDGTAAGQDHDAAASLETDTSDIPAPPDESFTTPCDDDILFFPRGAAAGDCIHAVFERADYGNPASYDAAISAALRAHPQRRERGTAESRDSLSIHSRMLRRMLGNVTTAPLHDDIVLSQVPAAQRLVELGFYLPAPDLSADTLNAWLKAHGYAAPRFAFATLHGYLRGFIDLVFEHRGSFYLLDWKSNHLGMTPQHYAPARLGAAMREHGYHLQHLFYSVALHRHLRRTLPGYEPARHLGGALYLFVRSVRPGWHISGEPCGVFFHRTPVKHIISLDRLIAGSS